MKPYIRHFIPLLLGALAIGQASAQSNLRIDFSRTAGDVQTGYQGYLAAHEAPGDYIQQDFTAFGGTVSITPSFAEALVQNPQMILRGQVPPSTAPDLLKDWIGIDNRDNNPAATGGAMTITISGVPAGTYQWTSYHHDPENQGGLSSLLITDSNGPTAHVVDQSAGGGAAAVPTTVTQDVVADGSDIIVVFNTSQTGATTGISVWNGFDLISPDTDGDGLLDLFEDEFFGDNSGTVEPSDLTVTDDPAADGDSDNLSNLEEQNAGTNPTVADTDNDGIDDDKELSGEENPWLAGVLRAPFTPGTDPAGDPTDPINEDSDGDLLLDGEEINGEANTWVGNTDNGVPPGDPSDPNATDSDGDGFSDTDEIDGNVQDPEGLFWALNPALADSDGDGVDDDIEVNNITQGWDPTMDDSTGDFDGDLLNNGDEVAAGTDPSIPDTDGDGRTDNEEVNGAVTSNPLLADTDGDLINDKAEVDNASDPNDPGAVPSVAHLQVDFGVSPDGPLEVFYQPYLALNRTNSTDSDPTNGDPLGVDRLNEPFAAFGGTVNLSVSFPDLDRTSFPDEADLAVLKLMINRTDGETANYEGTKASLIRNWIGVDSRFNSNGNGVDVPTTLRLQLDGVPAGSYRLRTYHHDVQVQSGRFGIVVTDSDSTAALVGSRFRATTSAGGSTDNPADPGAGNGPDMLHSTVEQLVRSNGTDPIIIDFQASEDTANRSMLVLNGLELEAVADADGDDLLDDVEIAIWGDTGTKDGTGDQDGDGLTDLEEVLLNLNPISDDSDGDGYSDKFENDTYVETEGSATVTDISVAGGNVTINWVPAQPGDIEAGIDLMSFPELAAQGVTPPATFAVPAAYSAEPAVFFRVIPGAGGFGTSPYLADTDGDGVSDGDEVNTYGSSPLLTNTDGDAFGDGHEVATGGDPADPNSGPDDDGDGYSNLRETNAGTDPDDAGSFPTPDPATSLFVDFNSNQDEGGDSTTDPDPGLSVANHNQVGYQSYHANHEVIAEFSLASYSAFGTTVTLLPEWPDTTDNRAQQSIDRTNQDATGAVLGSWDALWIGDEINLLTDWLGVDTRTANGGLGNYDGTTGSPSRLTLTLGNLPAGGYEWTSFHHDTEHVWAGYQVEVDTGAGFGAVMGPFNMTNSGANPNPGPGNRHQGYPTDGTIDPVDLPSTFVTSFTADGVNDVVIRFTPLTDTAVHRQIWAINGFQLVKQP